MDPLATVGPLRPGAEATSPGGILMVRPVGTAGLSILGESPPAAAAVIAPGSAPVLHAFAAPGMLRISGLDQIDAELTALAGGAAPTLIWYPIRADGTLGRPVTANSFADLMIEAMLRETSDEDPQYESADVLVRSLDEMQTALETSDLPVDSAIWILRGGQLPPVTPQALSDFLTETPQSAPIQRLGGPVDRGAMRWLYILSGFFSQEFSEAYVSGPIAVVRPTQAFFEMAASDRSISGPLLANPDGLLRQIQSNWSSRLELDGGTSRPVAVDEPGGSVADGVELAVTPSAYSEIGLVVPIEAVDSLEESLLAMIASVPARSVMRPEGVEIDPLALWLLTADGEGRVVTSIVSSVGRGRAEDLILEDNALLEEFEGFLLNAFSTLRNANMMAGESGATCSAIFLPLGSGIPLWSGE